MEEFNEQVVKDFLSKTAEKSKALTVLKEENEFNIFRITGIDTREVRICSLIFELLRKDGTHSHGTEFLKLFFEYVLNRQIDPKDLEKAAVYSEYVIENNRRIDLFITYGDVSIPIEVKIYAGDQEQQLKDYANYCKNSPIYYLTLDAHKPSEDSSKGLQEDEYCCVSFIYNIDLWLAECIKASEEEPALREVLSQFRSAMRRITGKDTKIMNEELYKLFNRDSVDYIKTADNISKSLPDIKAKKMLEVLEKIKEHIEQKYATVEGCKTDYYDYEMAKKYYEQKGSTYPAIAFKLPPELSPDMSFAFRIEIDTAMYFGIGNYDDKNTWGNNHYCKENPEQFDSNKFAPYRGARGNDAWYWWLFAATRATSLTSSQAKEEEPNFRDHNDSYYKLFTNEGFEEIIGKICNSIDDAMDKIGFPKKTK